MKRGYKATDSKGVCLGYQFSLPTKNDDGSWTPGDWHDHLGKVEICKSGFHFCEFPSGPWAYYSAEGTRVFVVEAESVTTGSGPGADLKHACARIRLVEEVSFDGNWNTGYQNTGYRNTGDQNTGNWNTGDQNTGNWNTGDQNTGYQNTGNRNTGYQNTGYRNTGNRNTGDQNTGDQNTGNWNTGNWNTGNWNTGFFCQEVQTVKSFDVDSGLTRDQFLAEYPESHELGRLLMLPGKIAVSKFERIPGITAKKLKSLHERHLAAREAK